MTKKLIMDLDNTITIHKPELDYSEMPVNKAVVEKMHYYRELGYQITVFTARNMRTYNGNTELIEANTLPIIHEWLTKYDVPFDEIIIGKPWCSEGFYVDDKAIRPSEFVSLQEQDILELINAK